MKKRLFVFNEHPWGAGSAMHDNSPRDVWRGRSPAPHLLRVEGGYWQYCPVLLGQHLVAARATVPHFLRHHPLLCMERPTSPCCISRSRASVCVILYVHAAPPQACLLGRSGKGSRPLPPCRGVRHKGGKRDPRKAKEEASNLVCFKRLVVSL